MQSALSDGSRGFAGLASLGIPVDDLLSGDASPLNTGLSNAVPPLEADGRLQRREPRWGSRNRIGAILSVALLVLVAVSATALFVWRDNTVAPGLGDPATPVDLDTANLAKPPIGSEHVLTRAEIRYCLAEEMRLESARGQVGTQRLDIDRLNASVADLNARCGSFQYQGSDLALAEADIAGRTAEFVAAGRSAFLLPVSSEPSNTATSATEVDAQSSLSVATDTIERGDATEPATVAVSDPEQQKRVRDVQWLLFKLGFYNGVMSGVDSEDTQVARAAYLAQRNRDPSTSLEDTLALLKADTENDASTAAEEQPSAAADADVAVSQAPEPQQASAVEPVPIEADTAASPAVTPDLSGLADTDRLAIEQLCRATASAQAYPACIDQQLSDLRSVPKPTLGPLSDNQRREVLAQCGPVRGREGPAAYYRCVAKTASTLVTPVVAAAPSSDTAQLPQNVVSAIESRCAAMMNAEPGEYARCVSGQFANLSDALNPLFITEVEFSERASIESVCGAGPGVGDVSAFYHCIRAELGDLRQVGAKPEMQVASFEDRKHIEAACQQDRIARGPADYYRCLDRELKARGY